MAWHSVTMQELPKADYMPAASFTGDIGALATRLGVELHEYHEAGLGPVQVLAFAAAERFAVLEHHPQSPQRGLVVIHLLNQAQRPQGALSRAALESLLPQLGLCSEQLDWISPYCN